MDPSFLHAIVQGASSGTIVAVVVGVILKWHRRDIDDAHRRLDGHDTEIKELWKGKP